MSALIATHDLHIMMLELAVEKLHVPRKSVFDSAILKRTTIMFRLLDDEWTALYPHRSDHRQYRGSNYESEPFHGGKSIVFSLPEASLQNSMEDVDLQIHVSKEVSRYFEMHPSQNVGFVSVKLDKLFNGIINELKDRKELAPYLHYHEREPISRSMKGAFMVLNENSEESGSQIDLYIRLSYLGKSIITEIVTPEAMAKAFYAQEETNEKYPYQCRELKAMELETGGWGSVTFVPPTKPHNLQCDCQTQRKEGLHKEKIESHNKEEQNSKSDHNKENVAHKKEGTDKGKKVKEEKRGKKRKQKKEKNDDGEEKQEKKDKGQEEKNDTGKIERKDEDKTKKEDEEKPEKKDKEKSEKIVARKLKKKNTKKPEKDETEKIEKKKKVKPEKKDVGTETEKRKKKRKKEEVKAEKDVGTDKKGGKKDSRVRKDTGETLESNEKRREISKDKDLGKGKIDADRIKMLKRCSAGPVTVGLPEKKSRPCIPFAPPCPCKECNPPIYLPLRTVQCALSQECCSEEQIRRNNPALPCF